MHLMMDRNTAIPELVDAYVARLWKMSRDEFKDEYIKCLGNDYPTFDLDALCPDNNGDEN